MSEIITKDDFVGNGVDQTIDENNIALNNISEAITYLDEFKDHILTNGNTAEVAFYFGSYYNFIKSRLEHVSFYLTTK